MKKLGQLSAMVALILSLALSTYAGHIDCGYTDPPPDTTATNNAGNPVTQAIVTVIADALSLL
jgi:hypothetical protein